MPRMKANGKPRDPIYTQARWGAKKTEMPGVRTGGRIKKVKTIFDPSDKASKSPVPPVPSAEQQPEKRRLSLSSQTTTISVKTAASDTASKPGPSAKKRKLQAISTKKTKRVKRLSRDVVDEGGISIPAPPVTGQSPVKPPTAARNKKMQAKSTQCYICRKGDASNTSWINCNGCKIPAHQKCTAFWSSTLGPWLCRLCHVCYHCEDEIVLDACATCTTCLVSIHYECVEKYDELPFKGATNWQCRHCRHVKKKPQTEGVTDSEATDSDPNPPQVPPPPPAAAAALPPPQPSNSKTNTNGVTLINPNIPDASNWTAKDVHDFFVGRFPEEAGVFQEQEIDGVSLLLMRRSDVIQGLGFKLGPALRIFKQIIMLQTRDPDPTLTWY